MVWVLGAALFLFGLLVSIGFHEMGHLVPARLFDVKVTQWMVGFGPTAWSRRRGDTEYGIKWLPMGGYIRMVGMLPPGADAPPGRVRRWSTGPFRSLVENARDAAWEEVEPGDEERLFYRKRWWQRAIIMSGGPAMNLVLAFVFLSIALMGIGVTTPQPVVGSVQDCVIPVAQQRTVCADGDLPTPAAVAGLRPGDRLVSFDGRPVRGWDQVTGLIRGSGGVPVTLGVRRGDRTIPVTLTPIATDRPSPTDPSTVERVGFLGVEPTLARVRSGPGTVGSSLWHETTATVQSLGGLPGRMVGVWRAAFGSQPRDLNGPVGMVGATRLGGDAIASDAPVADRTALFLELLASINLAIGLFNLVPLLPLDGGHIGAALWEALRRAVARVLGRRAPGYVDIAKTLPLTYAIASVLVVMAALLAYADIVNPVRLPG